MFHVDGLRDLIYFVGISIILLTMVMGFRLTLRTPEASLGYYLPTKAIIAGLSIGLLTLAFLSVEQITYKNLAYVIASIIVILVSFIFIKSGRRQRQKIIDIIVKAILAGSAGMAILVTLAIVFSLISESFRFFQTVPFLDFISGTRWSPGVASATSPGYFGVLPLLLGTAMITFIAMFIAIPAGLMSAIFLSCYAHERIRSIVKPLLELLAGIPTVVYGFLALIVISPMLQSLGQVIGLPIAAESALGVGLVMGFMILPYIASLSDDVIMAVPRTFHDGSLALGATESETIKKVIVPAAFPGIMASFLLAISRAVGETMIVVMAAGYSARNTFNPLEAVTTVTVQIVSLLTGDQEFSSPKTLAAFALGLMLLIATLLINMIAMRTIRHYREKYAS